MRLESLFDLDKTIAKDIFKECIYGFEVLPNIGDFILNLGNNLSDDYNKIDNDIWIHKSVILSDKATIIGPCIIDEFAEIRPGAYIRGKVIVGKNCVVGNSSEIKNSILFDNVQIPHFNYVGDSILGFHAHLGAGVILSNIKNDKKNIVIKGEQIIETNLRKMGSLIGDYVEVGCNSVLNPGTVIGRHTNIYPVSRVRGVVQSDSIYKDEQHVVKKETENV